MTIFPDGSPGAAARLLAAMVLLGTAAGGSAFAQSPTTPPSAAAPSGAPPSGAAAAGAAASGAPASDPVLATVNGTPIHMSDLSIAAQSLPAQARSMPPQQLYPMLLDQMIDGQALLLEAQKTGLDKDPAVQRVVKLASERALESAMLSKEVRPQVTPEAIKAKYDQEYANKPGEPEVHARHILVADEATAKKIIVDLKKGDDFAALSKQYSKDPGASAQGGDLGWFKKTDMVPEFADAAFALKDGEVSPTPVHTQFGWHVIQVLGHRTAPPPGFDEVKDQIRQQLLQEAVQKAVAQARSGLTVQRFNVDGSPVKATDTAEPPAK